MNLIVTQVAKDFLYGVQTEEGGYPHLSLQGGGCSGFKYAWNLIKPEKVDAEYDIVLEQDNGLNLVVDKQSSQYLDGIQIDYVTSIKGSYIDITNPQVTGSCGCGDSIQFDIDATCPSQSAGDAYGYYDPNDGLN